MAQINARLGADVKRAGDATLARFGVSATDAIRALWGYLARAQCLPAFMAQEAAVPPVEDHTVGISDQGAALAVRMAREQGLAVRDLQPLSYEELRDLAFEELLEEGRSRA